MEILAEVRAIVAEVLEVSTETLAADALLVEDLGMDSVLAIDIATVLEKRFKVRIPEDRMREFKDVRAIAAILQGLLAKQAEDGSRN